MNKSLSLTLFYSVEFIEFKDSQIEKNSIEITLIIELSCLVISNKQTKQNNNKL